MRILVACELPPAALEELRALGSDVNYSPQLTEEALPAAVAGVGLLIVGNLRVGPKAIAAGTGLQMIVRAGPGAPNIATDHASAQGVFVTHCPHNHATAVAELTIGLMLALDRQVVENTVSLREGRWDRTKLAEARGLAGRTIGILGYGPVGRLVARRARAFEMRVLAWSPNLAGEANEDSYIQFLNWPRDLARAADVITVHGAYTIDHPTLVDADFLAHMKTGASLVHVGNPAAVDETALAEAVQSRKLRVALDVYNSEPAGDIARFKPRLVEMPGVICTQHIGPFTDQAREAIAAEVARIVREFLVSGNVLNCLNLAERSPATWQLILRVRDQVGIMASILDAIRADGINAEEITSRVFTGAQAAWCTIALDERPSTDALNAIRSLPDVLHLELRAVV